MKYLCFILFLFIAGWVSSCNVINPSEKTPTYVHIDSFEFVPTLNTGTSSHKITSAWVYFNNQNVGVFDLPATIPILNDKPGQILVTPGITYSGLNNIQYPYPYYAFDTMSISTGSGQVVNFSPKTHYISDTLLSVLNEDFETANSFFRYSGTDTIMRVNDPNLVYEGKYAAYIKIDSADFSEFIMNQSFTVNGTEAFVEIDYKSSIPFEVGLQATGTGSQLFVNYLYGFKPRSEWNKIYVGLQELIATYPDRQYWLIIKAVPQDASGGYVQLDNIKIISAK